MLIRLPKSLSVCLATLLLSMTLTSVAGEPVPEEFEIILEIGKALESFCLAADCSSSQAAIRHLREDDNSMANRVLEKHLKDMVQKRTIAQDDEQNEHRHLQMDAFDLTTCLVSAIGCSLYLDNLFLPPVEKYQFNDVVLSDECEFFGLKEIEFTHKAGATEPEEFRYQSLGPPQLQGVFNLQYNPCDFSSLTTFAESTRTSGGGVSTGEIGDVNGVEFEDFIDFLESGIEGDPEFNAGVVLGPVRNPSEYVYATRVLGDSNWAFGAGVIAPAFITALDLVYKWVLLDGTVKNPKKLRIIPDIKIPFTCLRFEVKDCLDNFLKLEAKLVEDKDTDIIGQGCVFEAEGINAFDAGAVVWRRDSWMGDDPDGPPGSCYFLIQIIDGEGNKIDETWDDFVRLQGECQGTLCPINTFSAINGDSDDDGDSGFCQCAYGADLPFGVGNISPFLPGEAGGKGLKRGRRRAESDHNENTARKPVRPGGLSDRARQLQEDECERFTSAPTDSPSPTSAPLYTKSDKSDKSDKKRRGRR